MKFINEGIIKLNNILYRKRFMGITKKYLVTQKLLKNLLS